jgi:flagellar P-ring protein precursor FlgI
MFKRQNVMRHLEAWLLVVLLSIVSNVAMAQRIKDVAAIQGVRSNQLVGYGLVVGLPGTGEQSPFTEQSFRAMLSNFGIAIPSNLKPKIKNVAAVAVHAELHAFSKPGQTIDVTVSSMGEAKSLYGGTLLQTFLKGLDGQVYAVAQGSLVASGFGVDGDDGSRVMVNTPTVARIANGAMVEREVKTAFGNGDFVVLNLHRPDFTTARDLARTINSRLGVDSNASSADWIAYPLDAASIRVKAPRSSGDRVSFLSVVQDFEFNEARSSAKVVVNSRTGTIVIGQDVKLLPAAITHGGLQVTIAAVQEVAQPEPFADGETVVTNQNLIDVRQDDTTMFVFDPGATLDELVQAVNEVGAAPGDLMAILEALKEAGALQGELVII